MFTARARYVRCSPLKLRPIAAAVRGKAVVQALGWLSTDAIRRSIPIRKLIESAVANGKQTGFEDVNSLVVSEIEVDRGPIYRYYKPERAKCLCAMGRSNVQRKRFSHINVILRRKDSTSSVKRG